MPVKIFCRAKKFNRMFWFLHVLYFHELNRSRVNSLKNATIKASAEVLLKMQKFWNVTAYC